MAERPLRVALVNQVARLGGAVFSLLSIAEHIDRRAVELVGRRTLVAPAAGGVLELVDDGRPRLLVAPGDIDALADVTRAAAAVTGRAKTPRGRGEAPRHVQESFSLERDAARVGALCVR